MTQHYITLTATGEKIGIRKYIDGIKAVLQAEPDTVYSHGLTTWWPVTADEIKREYRHFVNQRINDKAGESWRNTLTAREINEIHDAMSIRDHYQRRIIIHRFITPRLNVRFARLLHTDD